jgi:hypothetical protein
METALAVAEKVEAKLATAGAANADQSLVAVPISGLEGAGLEVAGMATAAVAGFAGALSWTGTVRLSLTLNLTLALALKP